MSIENPFYLSQGKYFLFLERCSQLHRELVPIQLWLIYLLNGYDRIPGKVMGVILVAVYMVFKGKSLIARGKAFKVACEKLMQSRVSCDYSEGNLVFACVEIMCLRTCPFRALADRPVPNN